MAMLKRLLPLLVVGLSARLGAAQATLEAPSTPERVAEPEGDEGDGASEVELGRRWLAHSPEVASWRTQIGSARFDVVTAKLWPNPELALLGNFLVAGAPPDGKRGYQAQLTAQLPIFGQRSARVATAKELVGVAEMNVLALLWDRAYTLHLAMVRHAFAQARVDMLQQNLREIRRIRAIVALRTERGATSPYDLVRVDLTTGTLEAEVTNAEVERARAEAELLGLIADPTLTSARVRVRGLSAFRGPDDEAKLVALAEQRRPDLLLAQRGVRAAQRSVAQYKRERIPTPSVVAGGYWVQQQYGVQLTGGLSFTLPTSDLNQGLIGRALSDKHGSELYAQALATRIHHEVAGAYRARAAARRAVEVFRAERLPTASELLRRAEVSYQLGQFSIAQLFDAYQSMWEARAQELSLERQRAEAEVDLERAAALWPVEVALGSDAGP